MISQVLVCSISKQQIFKKATAIIKGMEGLGKRRKEGVRSEKRQNCFYV